MSDRPKMCVTWGDADAVIAGLVAERDAAHQENTRLRAVRDAEFDEVFMSGWMCGYAFSGDETMNETMEQMHTRQQRHLGIHQRSRPALFDSPPLRLVTPTNGDTL